MSGSGVSIIIPIYNVERYLRICLDSVMAQTFSDYEVILVDDGSTDSSVQICESYCKKDSRFKLVRQENLGVSEARNTGLRHALGEFIYYIDSDDCINSRLLEIAMDVMKWKNANLVQVSCSYVPEEFDEYIDKSNKSGKYWREATADYDIIESLYNLDRDDKSRADDIRLISSVVWSKLYRRNAFENMVFPDGMRMHEDQMIAHRYIAAAGGMTVVNLPLYYYRQSRNSLIRVGWNPTRLAIIDSYKDRLNCVLEVRNNIAQESDEKIVRAQNLVDYVYDRFLVCLLRNYCVVDINMKGDNKKEEKRKITKLTKELLKNKQGNISLKKRIQYRLFLMIPCLFVFVYKARNR